MRSRLKMVEVHTRGDLFAERVTRVPAYVVVACRGEPVHQARHFASHHVVDDEPYVAVLRQIVGDRGRRVEGVRIVVVQRELCRYRHDLKDRVAAANVLAVLIDELIADVDRDIQFFLQMLYVHPYRSAVALELCAVDQDRSVGCVHVRKGDRLIGDLLRAADRKIDRVNRVGA